MAPSARSPRSFPGRARLVRWLERHGSAFALTAAIAGLAAAGFLELADDVDEARTARLDRRVLMLFRSASDPADPLGPGWFEEFVRDLTALGSLGVLGLVTAVALGYSLMRREKVTAAVLFASVASGLLLSTLLKSHYDRPRPDLVPHGMSVYTQSFPSGHSMLSAVVYLALAAVLLRTQPELRHKVYLLAIAVVLTLLVGASRVYLGVHWPSDVLAGWAVGVAWAALTWFFAGYVARHAGVDPESKSSA